MKHTIIVNADDFGYDHDVNRAIIGSFIKGYCTSTTIMANMPGFHEACDLVHEHELHDKTGIHWVLTEGKPLTEAMRKCPLFCNKEGQFSLSRGRRVMRLSANEKVVLAGELRAQIQKCRNYGLRLTHADSHKHIHEEWGIASVVLEVCLSEGIPYLRLARNCGHTNALYKLLYRYIVNFRIRHARLARTQYFGSPDDFSVLLQSHPVSSVEIMVHPIDRGDGILVDTVTGLALSDLLRLTEQA